MIIKRQKLFSTLCSVSTIMVISCILIIILNRILSLQNFYYDFTEEKLYTLSEATKAQVKEVKEPISIRFFCSIDSKYISKTMQRHYQQILLLLQKYHSLNSNIHLSILDPNQSPYAKLNAELDKITPHPYDKITTWCGLSISSGNQTITLPFIYPEKFDSLEYDLTRIIRVFNTAQSQDNRIHRLGILTSLPVGGRAVPPTTPGKEQSQLQPLPAWHFLGDLAQDSAIVPLDFSQPLTPERYQTIIIIHPQKLALQTLYLLDQYLLLGGNLIVYLDPYCTTDAQLNPSSEGIVARLPSSSNFNPFLKKWGIEYNPTKIMADLNFKSISYSAGSIGFFPTLLSISSRGFNNNQIAIKDLSRLQMTLAGGFEIGKTPDSIKVSVLCHSSKQSNLVDRYLAQEMTKTHSQSFNISGQETPLIIELTGCFQSCYKNKPINLPFTYEHIDKSIKPSKVFLFPDVDMLYDNYCVEKITTQGNTLTSYSNDNIRLLQNIIDVIKEDTSMIKLRSRFHQKRALTKLQLLAIEADERYGKQIVQLGADINKHNETIESLKKEITDSINEQGEKIKENTAKITLLRNERQEMLLQREDLAKKKNKITSQMEVTIKVVTTITIPILVILMGCIIACCKWIRRKS